MTLAEIRAEMTAFREFRGRKPAEITMNTGTWNSVLAEAYNAGAIKTVGEEFEKRHRFVEVKDKGECCERCGQPKTHDGSYFCPKADTRPLLLGMRVELDSAFPWNRVVID